MQYIYLYTANSEVCPIIPQRGPYHIAWGNAPSHIKYTALLLNLVLHLLMHLLRKNIINILYYHFITLCNYTYSFHWTITRLYGKFDNFLIIFCSFKIFEGYPGIIFIFRDNISRTNRPGFRANGVLGKPPG